ncbi:hypothetical protein TanjilG_10232 [Lupinus angustifolius]|uniref:TIR domain-containing protein n=1 Tax=Lupinus angustifolius TaxID=3871 RepID=A0A4P1RBR8_LUPAN|nr:hypothetical protein TanjilG_10232 [Lupinus angustifolius]
MALDEVSIKLKGKYHVFLSFRGEDTRLNFTDHLYEALRRKGIITFRDDEELERGESISQNLLDAIEESLIAIVIISKNYASSTWCLDELQKIVDCKQCLGLQVFPIFYGVDPSHVGYQRESFEQVFKDHEHKFEGNKEKVQKWRDVLKYVAKLSGWDSKNKHESKLIEEIVEQLWTKLEPKLGSEKIQGIVLNRRMRIKFLSSSLNVVIWSRFPLKALPLNVQLDELVYLELRHSKIEKLWNGTHFFWNLKHINLSYSEDLIETPDISGAPNLKELFFNGCTKLVKVHYSVGVHKKLEKMSFSRCINLGTLPSKIEMCSLKFLGLNNCSKLRRLPDFDEKMKCVSEIYLRNCKNLLSIPNTISNLKTLKILNIYGCSKVERLPNNINENKALEDLDMSYTSIREVSSSLCHLENLKRLLFRGCSGPIFKYQGKLLTPFWKCWRERYRIINTESLILPRSISNLSSLILLNLKDCNLKSLPEDIGHFSSLEMLDLRGNVDLTLHLATIANLSKLRLLFFDGNMYGSRTLLPTHVRIYPQDARAEVNVVNGPKLWQMFRSCCNEDEYIEFFWNLKHINLSFSEDLIETPDISGAPNLKELFLNGCTKLVKVHYSVGLHKKLEKMTFSRCINLETLPNEVSTKSKGKYHVFLSFRGKDTRLNFTDHLYEALRRKGIITFRDDEELERGESISQNLLDAIEESLIAIVIISQNYASSTWCLDELQKIVDCKQSLGLQVFPIFYGVDPSHVGHQRESFEQAFKDHEHKFEGDKEKVQKWRDVLKYIAKLSGWDSKNKHESKLIEEIVEQVWMKLEPKLAINTDGLISIETKANDFISHLSSLNVVIWSGYPLKALPLDVQLDELVYLQMCHSKIEKLWNGTHFFWNLKHINLSYSEDLIETPDISGAPNLKELFLNFCTKLVKVHYSVGLHKKLEKMTFSKCINLGTLPSKMEMCSLKFLGLNNCSKLRRLPDFDEKMKCVSEIYLQNCKSLLSIPNTISNLKTLKILSIYGCSKVERLPNNINENKALEDLDMSYTSIREVNSSLFHLENLKRLLFRGCSGPTFKSQGKLLTPMWKCWSERYRIIKTKSLILPCSISDLSSLTLLNLKDCNLKSLPEDIGHLPSLEMLDLRGNVDLSLHLATIANLSKLRFLFFDGNIYGSRTLLPTHVRINPQDARAEVNVVNGPKLWQMFRSCCNEDEYIEVCLLA